MKSLDHKSSQLSTQRTILIFIGIFLVFIGAVIVMFYVLDPLGMRKADRDQQREKDAIELRTGLEKYHKDNILNIIDYNAFLDCGYGKLDPLPIVDPNSLFNKAECQAHKPPENVDVDDNNVINSFDYNLFLRELSVQNGD